MGTELSTYISTELFSWWVFFWVFFYISIISLISSWDFGLLMSPVNAQSLFLYTSFGAFPYLFLVLVYFGRVCSCFIFRVLVSFGFFGWFGFAFFFCCCCCLLIWFGFKILLLALTKLVFMLHLFLVWLSEWTDPLRCFWNSHSIPQLICSSWQTPRGRSLNKFCHSEIQV